MKNSADDNAVSLRLIEDDVFTLLKTADTRVNRITSPTQTGRVSKPVKAPGQLIKVVFGLFFAPGIYCVIEYLCQIRNTFRSKPVGAQAMLAIFRLASALRRTRPRNSAMTVGPSRKGPCNPSAIATRRASTLALSSSSAEARVAKAQQDSGVDEARVHGGAEEKQEDVFEEAIEGGLAAGAVGGGLGEEELERGGEFGEGVEGDD